MLNLDMTMIAKYGNAICGCEKVGVRIRRISVNCWNWPTIEKGPKKWQLEDKPFLLQRKLSEASKTWLISREQESFEPFAPQKM